MNAPMMDTMVTYGQKYNPGLPADERLIYSVQAWANVLALREALSRADRAGGLSGENVLKRGFETFRGVDIGLSIPPLSYTAVDHRVSGLVPVYEVKKGKFQLVEIVDLKSRWPEKWRSQWLGW
jgi:branched-chain amino acid transport system substrate-binding protein